MKKVLTKSQVYSFRRKIRLFYQKNKRNFPWRNTTDPYHILVSEIMLQQTQVDRVANIYPAFIQKFPTIQKLSQASKADVLKAWQGLGYNRRALYLQRAAQSIQNNHNGVVPDNPEILATLPGLGITTASSVAAFAFNKPAAFIETNIRAVFIHHFFSDQGPIEDKDIFPLIEQTLDKKSPYHWYSALMDYGTVLKKKYSNPSRNSKHHTKQSPFEGSDRQIRGHIVKLLLRNTDSTFDTIHMTVSSCSRSRLKKVLQKMDDEKMITVSRGKISLQ